MNFPSETIVAVLTDAAIKAAAVLLAASLATLAMRGASAAARHLLWVAAVAVALLLPIGSAMLPAHRIPILPAAREISPPVEIHVQHAFDFARPASAQPIESSSNVEQTARTPTDAMIAPAARAIAPASPPPVAVIAKPVAHRQLNGRSVILALWLAGTIVLIAGWMVGFLAAWQLVRRTPVVTDGSVFDASEAIRREMGIRASVRLQIGTTITMPFAGGFVRPFLLLPAAAADWPVDRLRSVLLHELGHIKRFDCLTQCLAQLLCALYWFNPLSWLAANRLCTERERACDDLVVAHGLSPVTYAEHLVIIAQAIGGRSLLKIGAVAMARPSGLRRRVTGILDRSRNHRILSFRLALVAAVIAVAVLLPLSSVHISRQSAVASGQVAVATTQPQAAAPATPLPALPEKIPGDRFALRVLSPGGLPMQIDEIKEISCLMKDGLWREGLKPKDLQRFADGWLFVDKEMFVSADPHARTEITFIFGGHTIHAETTFPLDSRQITFQSLADPNEINIDESTGPVAGPDEIAGRVVDPAGRPVAGASFESDAPDIAKKKFPERFVTETTDANGVFRVSPAALRSTGKQYFYELSAKGYATRWLGDLPVGKGFTIHLYNNTRLRGKLVLPDGQAAAGATLEFTTTKQTVKQNNNFAFPFTSSSVADAIGSYDIPVEPGIYEVEIASPSGGTARLENVPVASGAVVALPSQLDPGATLTLQAVNCLSGKPIAGAHFAVRARANGWIVNQPGTDRVSDAQGMVHWDNLVPGEIQFSVKADGYARWWLDAEKQQSPRMSIDSLRIDVATSPTPMTVKMERVVRTTGQVLAPDGTPVAGAIVNIAGIETGDSRYARSADAQGKFLLQFPDLRENTQMVGRPWPSSSAQIYAIVACDPQRRWANTLSPKFVPTPGATNTFTIQMTAGGRMHGRVVDAAGKPVPHIEVEAVNSDNSDCDYYNPRTLTDADGHYELPPMRPGDYKLYPDIKFRVDITIPPNYVPAVIHIDEGETLAVPDLIYDGPPPPPVPSWYDHQYYALPSFPATAPATKGS